VVRGQGQGGGGGGEGHQLLSRRGGKEGGGEEAGRQQGGEAALGTGVVQQLEGCGQEEGGEEGGGEDGGAVGSEAPVRPGGGVKRSAGGGGRRRRWVVMTGRQEVGRVAAHGLLTLAPLGSPILEPDLQTNNLLNMTNF
jgi:hypothetical protein